MTDEDDELWCPMCGNRNVETKMEKVILQLLVLTGDRGERGVEDHECTVPMRKCGCGMEWTDHEAEVIKDAVMARVKAEHEQRKIDRQYAHTTVRTPDMHCPWCGQAVDAHTDISSEDTTPGLVAGALTVCVQCNNISAYESVDGSAALQLRKSTFDEYLGFIATVGPEYPHIVERLAKRERDDAG